MTAGSSVLAGLAKSKIKTRAAIKGMSVSEIEKLIGNLSSALETEKKKASAKAEAARAAKIAKIRALMEESGLDTNDLKASGKRRGRKKTTAKKRKVAPKYRLVVDGQEYLWSGRGRAPKVFKDYMDSGKSKESCTIK